MDWSMSSSTNEGFPNSVPQIWESTSPHLAVVRLDGRNAATSDVKGKTTASDRFNYDYPNDELFELATSPSNSRAASNGCRSCSTTTMEIRASAMRRH